MKTWTFKKGTEPHYQGLIYDETTGKTVAISYNDESGKNTALLSAAPELLEALQALIWQYDNNNGQLCGMALQDARAAINKAEGN